MDSESTAALARIAALIEPGVTAALTHVTDVATRPGKLVRFRRAYGHGFFDGLLYDMPLPCRLSAASYAFEPFAYLEGFEAARGTRTEPPVTDAAAPEEDVEGAASSAP